MKGKKVSDGLLRRLYPGRGGKKNADVQEWKARIVSGYTWIGSGEDRSSDFSRLEYELALLRLRSFI